MDFLAFKYQSLSEKVSRSMENLRLALQPPKTKFDFEDFVVNQLGVVLVRPPIQEVCQYYLKNQCKMGNKCAFKHPSKTKLVVCKHWLRGLCKKGELCEFLHEYNLKVGKI
jgi:cleavage and polyadenylation specificity factor subunit 4